MPTSRELSSHASTLPDIKLTAGEARALLDRAVLAGDAAEHERALYDDRGSAHLTGGAKLVIRHTPSGQARHFLVFIYPPEGVPLQNLHRWCPDSVARLLPALPTERVDQLNLTPTEEQAAEARLRALWGVPA